MKLFIDKLIETVKAKNSHVCVGLDPHLDLLPKFLIKEAESKNNKSEVLSKVVLKFNRAIIDQIVDIAVAVKPQIAFYELIGKKGFEVLKKTIEYAREKKLIVILDAKRNDIGSTASAYAEAYLGIKNNPFNKFLSDNITVDAITINPYLGIDGVKPFLQNKTKGSFALVKTSNKSSKELQDLELMDGKKVYEKTGSLVSSWGKDYIGEFGFSNLGAVIGATYPEQLKKLRKQMPHTYFLLPGYGFQGGSAEDITYGFNQSNLGSIINSSRGIIFAYTRNPWAKKYNEKQFARAAREAVIAMKESINTALKNK
ncbi:MAG: orotidine-5'-phosphate decarboxylase [Bacillota bacterium]